MIEIRFAGFGGQGIVRSGYIVGKAVTIYDNKYATFSQSYGPEARGGACSAQVGVDDDVVLYPYVSDADVLVTMSQEAYNKYHTELKEGGTLLYDEDLVKATPIKGAKMFSIPATRFAEEAGKRIIANVVMLGFFTAMTEVVSAEAMKNAIPEYVPERMLALNLEVFDRGYNYGLDILKA